MELMADMAAMIGKGLGRSAITSASEWASTYRYIQNMYGEIDLYNFQYHPWSLEMHDIDCEHMVGQKAAQMAFTETAINRAFKAIDIDRQSVLYVLPTERPDAADFSSARFDPALEMSPHLSSIFSDTKNLGLKRAGNACLYVRSARSRSQLKSIPAGVLFFDELDEMDPASVILGRERSSGQLQKFEFDLSTPTVPKFGINGEFEKSDQRHFIFKCPHCSRLTELVFPDCIKITADQYYEDSIRGSYYICKECKHKLNHQTKKEWLGAGVWQPMFQGRHIVGYHINQMYSFTIEPWKFAENALRRHISEEDEQEFFNSKLGLPHVVKGAKINDADIEKCTRRYTKSNGVSDNQFICMGVDVGNKIHVEICEYLVDPVKAAKTSDVNLMAEARLITELTVDEFEELDELMFRYNVRSCVIDRQPEQRKAKEFTNRFRGYARTCVTTGDKISGRDVVEHEWEDEDSVSIDKTSWLDVALRRFKADTMRLPLDTSLEYRDHIKEPVRVYKKNARGEPRGIYLAAGPDHFAMARCYCEIAFKVGMSKSTNEDINGVT
jgi:hypothetical protein